MYLVFAFIVLLNRVTSSQQQCTSYYTVQNGDTCSGIWIKYSIPESTFYAYNQGINCQSLQIGQKVCSSGATSGGGGGGSTNTVYGCANSYTIKSGDTCASIIQAYALNSNSFYTLNPTINCNLLQIGQALCLSSATNTVTGGCSTPYAIKSGDTCSSIWTRYGMSESVFYSFNKGINCQSLQVGQVICLASSGTNTQITNYPIMVPTQMPNTCSSYYTIRQGDTCTSILNTYGQVASTFYSLNPTINCQSLQIGQQVCITGSTNFYQTVPLGTSTQVYQQVQCQSYYTVKQGDTCVSIMAYYGQLSTNFYTSNPNINCQSLQINQQICLNNIVYATTTQAPPIYIQPTTSTSSNSVYCQQYHVVRVGDTCSSIMSFYGQSTANFYINNPYINCNQLVPGQQLCLTNVVYTNTPVYTVTSTQVPIANQCQQYHFVRQGDTCANIIYAYGQQANSFYYNNPTLNCQSLQIGQQICLNNVIYATTTTTTPVYIPPPPPTTTPQFVPYCQQYYTVQQGDTCASIIYKYGQVQNSFYYSNPSLNCNQQLIPGTTVCLNNIFYPSTIPTPVYVPPTTTAYLPTCQQYVTAQQGDTCSSLIYQYGQVPSSFYYSNPLLNCNQQLPIGTPICLNNIVYPITTPPPVPQPIVYQPTCQEFHQVKQNESCASIVQMYGTTQSSLNYSNPTLNCNSLTQGEILCINNVNLG